MPKLASQTATVKNKNRSSVERDWALTPSLKARVEASIKTSKVKSKIKVWDQRLKNFSVANAIQKTKRRDSVFKGVPKIWPHTIKKKKVKAIEKEDIMIKRLMHLGCFV